jgi:hypothetical protein
MDMQYQITRLQLQQLLYKIRQDTINSIQNQEQSKKPLSHDEANSDHGILKKRKVENKEPKKKKSTTISLPLLKGIMLQNMKNDFAHSYYDDPKDASFAFRKLVKSIFKTFSIFVEKYKQSYDVGIVYRPMKDAEAVNITILMDLEDEEVKECIKQTLKTVGDAFFVEKCKSQIKIEFL